MHHTQKTIKQDTKLNDMNVYFLESELNPEFNEHNHIVQNS